MNDLAKVRDAFAHVKGAMQPHPKAIDKDYFYPKENQPNSDYPGFDLKIKKCEKVEICHLASQSLHA